MKNFEYKNGQIIRINNKKELIPLKKWHTYVSVENEKIQFIPYLKDETNPDIIKNFKHWNKCYQCQIENVKK